MGLLPLSPAALTKMGDDARRALVVMEEMLAAMKEMLATVKRIEENTKPRPVNASSAPRKIPGEFVTWNKTEEER